MEKMQGLSLLTMSAPPVLGWATGSCTAYEAEFIALVQRMLFCTSLPLIAVGVSAYYASTLTLIGYKLQSQRLPTLSASEPLLLPAASQSDYACTGNAAHWTLWTLFENPLSALLVVFLPGTAIIAVGYVSSWWIKFAIPAVVSVVSTIILLTDSSSSYKREQGGLDLPTDLTPMFTKIDIESVLLAIPMCINFIVLGVIFQTEKLSHRTSSRHEPLCWELMVSNSHTPGVPRICKEKLGGENEILC